MNKPIKPLVLLVLLLLAGRSAGAQISPDSGFNKKGYHLFTQDPGVNSLGLKVVTTASGATFVAGIRGNDSLILWKYGPDGQPDRSFGYGGFRALYTGQNGFQLYPLFIDLAIQRDGRIVVMATRWKLDTRQVHNTLSEIVLARFTAAGAPDPGFNGNGLLMHRPDAGYQFRPSALAIDSTGSTDKLYVGSLASENSNWSCPLGYGKWCISRYKSNGQPDAGWNGSGYVLESASAIRNAATVSPMAVPRAMRVLPSGKLLVAGAYNAADAACFIFRMNADGAFDATYGDGGRVYRSWPLLATVAPDAVRAYILQDESVVFSLQTDHRSGSAQAYDSSVIHAIRADRAGAPVAEFGKGGTLAVSYRNEGFHDLSFDAANRLMICWNEADAHTQRMHFARFTELGQPDTSFCKTAGRCSLEPIRPDAVYHASHVYGISWAPDNQHFFVLEYRYSKADGMHPGLFKFRLGGEKPAPAGIQSPLLAQIAVYPQPADGMLHISTTGAGLVKLALINGAGQVVMQQRIAEAQRLTVDVQHLVPGLYLLQLEDKSGAGISRKVLIAR